jgi:hypothetical protein
LIASNGIGNWLAKLTHAFGYPDHWWGAHRPWELTEEQADFVCRHRYDVGHSPK